MATCKNAKPLNVTHFTRFQLDLIGMLSIKTAPGRSFSSACHLNIQITLVLQAFEERKTFFTHFPAHRFSLAPQLNFNLWWKFWRDASKKNLEIKFSCL
jgi:hypothetical protein